MSDKENTNIGFSGIGKRIDDLKNNINTEDTTDWKQEIETETPRQTEQLSQEKQSSPKIYKQKAGLSFRLSLGKVFWGIIAIVIVASIFSQNNDKKKTDYASPPVTVPAPAPEPAIVPKPPLDLLPDKKTAPPPSDEDFVTEGQYRCSRYHHNRAQELKPSIVEKQDIERQQRILNKESDALDLLKTQIETDYVDHYSQSSVNQHNMLVRDYNSRLEMFRINVSNLQRRIDNYNAKITNYNNYLMNNCRKAY